MANTGAGAVADGLHEVADQLADMTDINAVVAAGLVKDAARRVHSKTGRLASTIVAVATPTVAGVEFGGPPAPYGGVVHFGWAARHIHGNPFATQAIEDTDLVAVYTEGIDNMISKAMST